LPRRSTRGNTIGSINTESSQRTSRPTRSSTRETAASLNNHPPTRASQNATSSLEDLPSSPGFRESPRRKSSITSPNYHDLSNSELSESESEHDERPKRKRVRISPPKQEPPKKKAKKPKKSPGPKFPQLEKWPGHTVKAKDLSALCNIILNKVEEFDAEQLFHIPVLEQYPDMEKKYLEKVETPMDFRTIRNNCVENYQVIGDLQEDLILVFRNCCSFNKVNSPYWKYAVEIWENLNQIFVNALVEMGIDLPRRFKAF